MTEHVSVKISNLRTLGFDNLREWLEKDKNIYVGRSGRIFIKEKDNTKSIFHYKGSKWKNPYKKGDDINSCLELYRKHIHDSGLINDIHELYVYNLGCFCLPESPCHAKILAGLANDAVSNHL